MGSLVSILHIHWNKPQHHSLYGIIDGYTPTAWICGLFLSLFAITTILHAAQAARYRIWWLFPTIALCGFTEVIGWSGRIWSSVGGAWKLDPYLMQITTTILAPSFLTAANFIILGRVIERLGRRYSRLSPQAYSYVFVTADALALIIQAVGGASASQVAKNHGFGDVEIGARIMLSGIIIQLVAITLYSGLAAEFIIRFHGDRPLRRALNVLSSDSEASIREKQVNPTVDSDLYRKARLMLVGLAVSTVLIYIRTIYRTIELNQGWFGPIMKKEQLFNTLDGLPIVLAMFILNFFHPGFLVP